MTTFTLKIQVDGEEGEAKLVATSDEEDPIILATYDSSSNDNEYYAIRELDRILLLQFTQRLLEPIEDVSSRREGRHTTDGTSDIQIEGE